MPKLRRRRIWIEPEIQGGLLVRCVMYWFFFLISVLLMVFCWNVYRGPPRPFSTIANELLYQHAPALVASVIVLPIVGIDVVRLSNRFVGPMYRLKLSLLRLGCGENVEPLKFRDDDYWFEMSQVFNQMLDRVQPAINDVTISATTLTLDTDEDDVAHETSAAAS